MEQFETKGLVIREIPMGEADKILTLLTPERGKITVSGKGVASLRSRHMASCQLFSYSNFILKKTRKYFYIAESDTIECFFNIRFDVEKLALANYLCEVVDYLALEEVGDEDLLRLALNTLYALSERKELNLDQIKASFELRAAAVSGFTPSLDVCGICGKADFSNGAVIDVMNGRLLCGECSSNVLNEVRDQDDRTANIRVHLTRSSLEAARFTVSAPLERYLSYSLDDSEIKAYGQAAETYLLSHIEHSFKSLEYYKDLIRYGYADE